MHTQSTCSRSHWDEDSSQRTCEECGPRHKVGTPGATTQFVMMQCVQELQTHTLEIGCKRRQGPTLVHPVQAIPDLYTEPIINKEKSVITSWMMESVYDIGTCDGVFGLHRKGPHEVRTSIRSSRQPWNPGNQGVPETRRVESRRPRQMQEAILFHLHVRPQQARPKLNLQEVVNWLLIS